MRHILFQENPMNRYPVAVLIKGSAFNRFELQRNYIDALTSAGLAKQDVIAFSLSYNDLGKAPAKHIKEYLEKLLPALDSLGTKHLYVADANYFKVLAGVPKADPNFGYALPCKVKGFEHMTVVLGLNHTALIYDPALQGKLNMSLEALASSINGTYQPPGAGIIHSAQYPRSLDDIAAALNSLHQYPELSADIEAFSLSFDKAGIGTIAFCWDQHNGAAFACDYHERSEESPDYRIGAVPEQEDSHHGYFLPNLQVRNLLREFFGVYKGRITWHNAGYDVKVLIYTLWMRNALDTEGLLEGLSVMTRSLHDTKIIAYLATNTTAGNVLGLKALAHEFAGNWAVEVKDIRTVPLDKLLTYNLIDGLCTNYVKDKFLPVMQQDNQETLYEGLMLPSLKLILQMELTGMPLLPERVAEVKQQLEAVRAAQLAVFQASPLVMQLNLMLRESEWEKDYLDRKSKAKNPDKILPKPRTAFDTTVFNPNSGPQLQRLLYELMGLPVIDRTDTKMPATGAETVEKLINHTDDPGHKQLLEALIVYGGVNKILNTFIPAFEEALHKGDGVIWLHGSFNLGGTVSGRLSSSDPNLQNIPANVKIKIGDTQIDLGKLIKSCFAAPKGWLFCGADFNSLEDYISALTTRDPNKLRVYTGHKVYELSINGVSHHIRDDTIIEYDGNTMTAEQFHETYRTL